MITQCPKCDTRFRVSEEQLRRAGGRVRCGACLDIFPATENLALQAEPASGEPATDTRDEDRPIVAEPGVPRAQTPAAGPPPPRPLPRERWIYRALAAGVVVLILQIVWYLAYR